MALWTGLGQAATVAQLVGADVGGLISMIVQAALTARQNRSECEQLARRALMIAQLLPHVQEPEAAQPLAGLGDTLRDAHELVVSCQGRSAAYQFVMAGRTPAVAARGAMTGSVYGGGGSAGTPVRQIWGR